MLPYRAANKLRIEDFRVKLEDRPGWVLGTTRVPLEGEEIFCAAGVGTVTALHGKTGDGSRLVQIRLENAAKHPFYAAASNVLLPPAQSVFLGDLSTPRIGSPAPAEPDVWLDGSGSATQLG